MTSPPARDRQGIRVGSRRGQAKGKVCANYVLKGATTARFGSLGVAANSNTGYQPVSVIWAEKDLIVADEFRDGNVPAHSGNWRVIDKALGQLPEGIAQIRLRADAALYENEVLRKLDDKKIGYAISARMSQDLAATIRKLPEDSWALINREKDAVRQWVEVLFVPEDRDYRKYGPVTRRYLAIRILKSQGSLFEDGTDRRHFAVVTNLDWAGDEIIRWHRLKAGTIEHAHDVMKNELAAGCFPSGKFGANAAWFRLNAILYNLLSLLKRETLPDELHTAKPKRLRFVLLNTVEPSSVTPGKCSCASLLTS